MIIMDNYKITMINLLSGTDPGVLSGFEEASLMFAVQSCIFSYIVMERGAVEHGFPFSI